MEKDALLKSIEKYAILIDDSLDIKLNSLTICLDQIVTDYNLINEYLNQVTFLISFDLYSFII